MQVPHRCVGFVALVIGCGGGDDMQDDAGGITGSGVIVEWSSQPLTWPADLGDGITIDRAEFTFANLRVVGDAGPGDPRTTASGFTVRWDEVTRPPGIAFTEAPTGLYSQVSLVIDGGSASAFDIRGHVFLDGTDWEYKIEDDEPVALTLEIEETFSPPAPAIVRLRLNFSRLLDVLDFDMFDRDNGRLELDNSSDPQMATFRTQLVSSIEVIQ